MSEPNEKSEGEGAVEKHGRDAELADLVREILAALGRKYGKLARRPIFLRSEPERKPASTEPNDGAGSRPCVPHAASSSPRGTW